MTPPVRFEVVVDKDWIVSVTGPGGLVAPAPPAPPSPRSLWPAEGPPPLPSGIAAPEQFLYQLWDTSMAPDIPAIYKKIFVDEYYGGADAVELGGFLFRRLLDTETWQAVRAEAGAADFVELALRFDAQRYDLHRFPWELLHDGNGFLAQGQPPVCVTRLVEPAPGSPPPAQPDPFERPARLLFVVGASLTDKRIQPGAEVLGLLRQLQTRDVIVNARVACSASPAGLRDIVDDFKPDLVHFICHGDIEQIDLAPPHGFLEFQREDKTGPVHRDAFELLGDLRPKSRIPPVVILSACYSGVAPGAAAAEEPRPAAVDRVGSLAAELVAGGVPVVVGMGGHIDDSACRLFTRFFVDAIIGGESLVAAAARGRRAAFLDGTPARADWAFPALFLAAGLKPYRPVPPLSGPDPSRLLADRIRACGVEKHHVFCGRHEFFERYVLLFRPGAQPVLPIYSKTDVKGLGRTCLLRRLAAQALRDGHIPCLVSSDETGWPAPPFAETANLAAEILKAIDDARKVFGLPAPYASSVLEAVLQARQVPDRQAKQSGLTKRSQFRSLIDEAIRASGTGPSADVCREALQEDLRALIDEARAASLPLVGPHSRVILLLDDVHRYDQAIEPLLHTLIQKFGLGTATEPVPVILCYSLGTKQTDDLFTNASETIGSRAMELRPFSEDGDEDLLAYEQVLLFPNEENELAKYYTSRLLGKLNRAIDGKVASFVIKHNARPQDRELWSDQFRMRIEGIPKRMMEDDFYKTTVGACMGGFLDLGDDEARLRKL